VIVGQRRPPDAILQVREVRCIHSLNATHAAIMLGDKSAIFSGARHFASPYAGPGRLTRLITLRARRLLEASGTSSRVGGSEGEAEVRTVRASQGTSRLATGKARFIVK
jgi:hypothetical protein